IYGFEKTEPHLWAWRVLEVARTTRNEAATMIGLPEKQYTQPESAKETDNNGQLKVGRYEGKARNTTRGSSIPGSVTFEVLSIGATNQNLEVYMSFSKGLCGIGTFTGKLSRQSFTLYGELTSNDQYCGERSWNMVTICRLGGEREIHCSYVLT